MGKAKGNSLRSFGLKYKLKISFYLMSILPLLISVYLVSNYILPQAGLKIDIIATIIISVVIAIAGFFIIKEVFDRVVSISSAAKLIAAGDLSRKIKTENPDEVGDLGGALNQLTERIRGNMDELKNYSEKTTEINVEIQKRVMVLSSLLQISSLISQGAKLDDILKLTVEKARLLANSEAAFLLYREEGQEVFLMRIIDGINSEHLLKVKVGAKDEIFSKAITLSKVLVIDRQNTYPDHLYTDFYDRFRLKNALVTPIYLGGRVMAMLGIANNKESFAYSKEEIELVDVFAKQVAIAAENDILMHRVEKLEIKDALTGLYNEAYVRSRLQEEIRRSIAYQRPCAFILLDIDNFKNYYQTLGSLTTESTLKKIAIAIRDSVSEVDRVGRIGDDEFGVILPEKNKRQAQRIAESIRVKIEDIFKQEADAIKRITISGGVSENPLDGVVSDELIFKAQGLLALAKNNGKNRIVGFAETVQPAKDN
ncbi:MAG: diguanylate cyclase [Candidatus Omnitrophica bacterium]|nr:diguanylate cyclase [Candidatus Omnitrophota bacterium]